MSTVSDRAPDHTLKDQHRRGLLDWVRSSRSGLGTGLIWLGKRLGGRSTADRGLSTAE